jgi:hypothetical protein
MIKRVLFFFPDFPISQAGWKELTDDLAQKKALSVQHQSRSAYYLAWPRAFRSLNNVAVDCRHIPFLRPFSEVNVGRDRHEEPTDEMVHVSSLVRWQEEILANHRERIYSPKNLRAVLAAIAATCHGRTTAFRSLTGTAGRWTKHLKDGGRRWATCTTSLLRRAQNDGLLRAVYDASRHSVALSGSPP